MIHRRHSKSAYESVYFIILFFGIISLCGDIIYEGARSVTGPYLYMLGGSAFIVGFVAGFGEFLGYGLRLISGYLADASKNYWAPTILGYGLLIAVPFLALAGSWELAAVLYIIERVGKGIRSPAKDAILSHVTSGIGRGWGFGIHEALDQVGAVTGPLIFTVVFLYTSDFRSGFALLLIPFVLMMVILILTRRKVPHPSLFEEKQQRMPDNPSNHTPSFRALIPYCIFTAFTMLGFAAFPLIAYHFTVTGVVPEAQIPLFYAIAMGMDGVVALVVGKAYDRHGLILLITLPFIGIIIPFAAFFGGYLSALIAVFLWGTVMGIQETILRAAIADYTHISKRGMAYGIFNTVYGMISWFAGSLCIGWVYGISIPLLIGFLVVMQLLACGSFVYIKKSPDIVRSVKI